MEVKKRDSELEDQILMSRRNDARVITDVGQSKYYDPSKAVLLSDSSESPTGFTLRKLAKQPIDKDLQPFLVEMNGSLYMLSSVSKEFICAAFFPNTVHGPSVATS